LRPTNNDYARGALAMAPVLIGVVPFAMVAGLAGVANGMTIAETAAFSLFTYAGAAQIAALELIGDDAPVWVALCTALIINLRFLMFSAALAPHFSGTSMRRRLAGAYLLVDHAFALGMVEARRDAAPRRLQSFYLGACLAFWVTWQVAALAGSLLGAGMPGSDTLEIAVPLSFLALLAPQLLGRAALTAAVVAACAALSLHQAPANLGMLLGTGAGILAGLVVLTLNGKRVAV
jgi:predicted branched-subunit amino acid permease